jgi:hypothetical protein
MPPPIKRPFVYNFRSRDRRFNKPIEPSLYTSNNVLKRENKREYWGPNRRNNITLRKKQRNNATRNATRNNASNATPVTRKRRNAIFEI